MLFKSRLVAALVAVTATVTSSAVASIPVYAKASVTPDEVILDVFADTGTIPLRGFGIRIDFASEELLLTAGGRYAGLWFLRGKDNIDHPYTDLTLPAPGSVRVVGGRLDGHHPGEGLAGDHILLATIVFERLVVVDHQIVLGLAGPAPYVNFAAADGASLDSMIEIQETVLVTASEDSDDDGLPDDYEISAFGDLNTSNGVSDTDGDGDDDHGEWIRGTNPTDPHSKFTVQIVHQADGSKFVIWTGTTDRVYELEWSRDLESFQVLATGIPGLGALVELLDGLHNTHPQGFYRVQSEFPTSGR